MLIDDLYKDEIIRLKENYLVRNRFLLKCHSDFSAYAGKKVYKPITKFHDIADLIMDCKLYDMSYGEVEMQDYLVAKASVFPILDVDYPDRLKAVRERLDGSRTQYAIILSSHKTGSSERYWVILGKENSFKKNHKITESYRNYNDEDYQSMAKRYGQFVIRAYPKYIHQFSSTIRYQMPKLLFNNIESDNIRDWIDGYFDYLDIIKKASILNEMKLNCENSASTYNGFLNDPTYPAISI